MAECSDLDRQIQMLRRREIISEEQVSALCVKAREILVQEGNVQPVDSPVTVSALVGGQNRPCRDTTYGSAVPESRDAPIPPIYVGPLGPLTPSPLWTWC